MKNIILLHHLLTPPKPTAMRKLLLSTIVLTFFFCEFAKAQIGIGTTTPNPAAQLDISSANKGVLLPRVALVSTISWSPLSSSPTDGMILYNTATAGSGTNAVAPGFYYWTNSMWVPIAQVPATAPDFQVTALNCQAAIPATGAYEVSTPVIAGASKTITVTPNVAGAYSVTTNTVAGVTFSAAGTFTAGQAGTPQNILLLASGTPTSAGPKTFIVTAGAQVCTFSINFTSPASFNCTGITNTLAQTAFISGNSYSGTITLPYTAGNGNSYSTTTITSNGLTLTRIAGTYTAGGGNIIYTVSGTYVGTGGATSFTLPESGCIIYMGTAAYNPGSLGCGNTPAGTYIANTPMTAANTKTISITTSAIGYYTASTNVVNGISFSGSGFIGNTGSSNLTLAASGTPAGGGTYNFTVTIGNQTCVFAVTFTALGTFNCAGITTTFTGTFVNGNTYNATITEPYTAGNGSAYPISTIGPIDGLTLSAPAGTYVSGAGSSIVYTISGTYTGATNGVEVFTLPESGCTVTLGAAAYVAASLNCTGVLAGSYVAGIPMTAANTKTFTINAASVGGYTISNTTNGVTFSGSGTISATGIQTITLTASGTPAGSGTFTHTISIGGQSCTFSVTYSVALTALCNSISNTINTPLISATAYTGTVTVPYIAGNGAAYGNLIVGPTSGLTLTRVPGVYSPAGGNVLYNLSGTYTGSTNSSQNFFLPEGCTVILGQPHLFSGTLSCAGALTGVFQVGISAVGNTKLIGFANIAPGTYSITSTSNAGINFIANNLVLSTGGSQTVTLTASGTPNAFGTFTYIITIDGQTCSFSVTILPAAVVNCNNIINGLPSAPLVSGTSYTGTVTEPYTAGNGQAYGAQVLTSNGLTLTRVAGTYAPGGGTVVYNIGGTYTGTLGYLTYTLPENNCLVSSGPATLGTNSLSCSNAPGGSYIAGVPMTSSNTKSVSFPVSTSGITGATTNTVNGISFAAGVQGVAAGGTSGITMTATGTPPAAGTFNYTVTVAGQTCSFPITFTSPIAFNCAGITNTVTGPLVNGNSYSGTITVPYTGGNGAAYSSSSIGPVNGLTITAPGGTYSGAGGTVVYTLSGTYSTSSNPTIFTIPESGCAVTIGGAAFTGGTLSCGGTLSGTYQNQVAVTGANTKVITVDVAAPGGYNFTTTSSLGITFSASGVFAAAGPQTVTLLASGTGNGAGTGSYTLNIGNQSCTFTVPVLAAVIVNCNAAVNTLPASLVNGTSYSGSITIPYTSILSSSYPAALLTVSGLTLTRVAGTYATSGNLVYNLSGTFTGTTGTAVNFTLIDGGCVFSAGGTSYTAGTINCLSGAALGNYVQNVPMTAANTKAILISVNNPGTWSVNTGAVNGVTFAGSGNFSGTGLQTALLTGIGTPAATGIFSYPVTIAGQNCNFNITYGTLSPNCSGIVSTLPTYLVNGATYNTGSVNLPFTAGNGTAYTATTVTVNGLTLTRVAGTYDAGGGTVVYNLSGVYGGAAGSIATFVLPEGCNVTAGFSTYHSPDCSGLLSGTYQAGVANTAANTKMIDLNFSAPGFYSINIASQNGINFVGSGYVTTSGIHTVTLTGNGTPTNGGTFNYTLGIGGQSCTFSVTYAPAATFNCGSITGLPVYQLVSGATYAATISEPYTSGNGSAYSSLSLFSSNLTLTRTAGTFSGAGGNVIYTLSGISNGVAAVFTLPENGCVISIGGIQYNQSTIACGALAGTYTAGTIMNASNTKTVSINVSLPGFYSATSVTVNGVTFGASGTTTTTGVQDFVFTASGVPVATGTYYYSVNLGGQVCTFGVTYQ